MDALATHRRLDQPVATAVTFATLVVAVAASAFAASDEIAASLFLIAMLVAGRTNNRTLVIGAALLATLSHLVPVLVDGRIWQAADSGTSALLQIAAGTLLWSSVYWMAAALLIWDPRDRNLGIEQIHAAFAHAPAAMALVDTEGTIVHANDAFVDLTGQDPSQLVGSKLDQLLGDPMWEDIRTQRSELLSHEDAHIRFDREFVRNDGRKVWASIYARMLRDPSGNARFAVLQVLDLTEQRRAQRALAISESRFRGIIENTGELTLVVDLQGRISYANPKAYEVLGASATSLIGAKPLPFIHPADRNEFGRAFTRTNKRPRETFRLTDVRLQDREVYLDAQFTGLGDAPGISGTVVTARITTDQVKAEKQLRLSESKFSTIFHSSPDAILILRSSDSTIVDFNTGFTRLLGFTREEGIGLPEPELKFWGNTLDRERVQAELEAHYECLDYETELVAKNGELLQAEISVRYVEIDGELCVLCIGRDITKRRLAEAALKESEEKFARIFTGSPDGIVIIGLADSRILDINDAFVVSSGFSYDELVGHRVNDLQIFDDVEQLKRSTEIVMKEGSLQNFELTFRTKKGEQIPALVSATVVELEGEKSLVCIAKDNRAQRDTEAKLRVSEERFRGAFENAPIGMLLTDTDGYIFQANHFAVQALAYTEAEMVGSHISRLVPTQERQSLKETFDRLLYRSGNVFRSERRMLCKDSMEIWTNFHVVLQRSEDGLPLYFIVQVADITEMKRSQERMERMAFYDTLTDLANRHLFGSRLEQAIAHAQRTETFAAMLYLDLDQFKRVNDTLGHQAGDELLREVARRLTHCVRAEDTVARYGGDEFAILLYDSRNARVTPAPLPRKFSAAARADHHFRSSPRCDDEHRYHDHPDRLGTLEHSDQERRPGDVSRQRTRPQQLPVLRRGNEHQGAESIAHRKRVASGARIERVRTVLPAQGAPGRSTHHRGRSADPLATSRTWSADTGQIHQRRRRNRRHRRHGRVGHPTSVYCRTGSDRANRRADPGRCEHLHAAVPRPEPRQHGAALHPRIGNRPDTTRTRNHRNDADG